MIVYDFCRSWFWIIALQFIVLLTRPSNFIEMLIFWSKLKYTVWNFAKNYFQWRRNKKFSAFLHVLEHDLLCKISTQSLWCRPLPFIIDLFLLTVIFLWLLFFAIYLHTFLNFNPWESLNIDHKWNVWFFINLIIDSVLHILIKDLFQSKYFSCRWGRGGGLILLQELSMWGRGRLLNIFLCNFLCINTSFWSLNFLVFINNSYYLWGYVLFSLLSKLLCRMTKSFLMSLPST